MFPSPSAPILSAFNHVLDQAAWARDRLRPFAGRAVHIAMFPFAITFAIGSDGNLKDSDARGERIDLDIVLPPETPLLALQGSDRVMKSAQINGPADLADTLSFVLSNLRWDVEEDLSRVIGDIAAHRVVAGLDAFAAWQRQAARNLSENVGEYLVEEKQALIRSTELTALSADIEALRNDLAGIEARLNRLGLQ